MVTIVEVVVHYRGQLVSKLGVWSTAICSTSSPK